MEFYHTNRIIYDSLEEFTVNKRKGKVFVQ
jgi:hypothetical protein